MTLRLITRGLIAVALLLDGFCSGAAAAADAQPIAIVHGTVVGGTGDPPLDDGTVLLRGGLIEAVGPSGAIVVPGEAQVIDARGMSLLPGLADLHVHLTGGWDGVNMDLLSYQRYLNALLYAGVTTVLDTGNNQPWVLQLRQESAAGRLLAPRIYCTGAMIDGPDPAWPDLAYALSSTAQIPALVKRDKEAGVDLIKGYANLSVRFLQSLAEAAGKVGLRVVVDQWERNGSPDVTRTGIAGLAHLPTRVMSPEDVRLLKERGLFVITTLVVNESFARTRLQDPGYLRQPLIADTTAPWALDDLRADLARPLSAEKQKVLEENRRQFEESKRNARLLLDAGILVAAGTDAPYPGLYQGEGIHRELELLVESGWTPLQAIRAATYDAARLLKAEGTWGSLRPGLRADLLIVAGRPAERIGDTRKIRMVIQGGRILDRARLKFDPARDPGFRAVPGVFVE
ncbi:MAG TPA: amidohydrolase family protein [Candidatus Polarisedimenticolia bacterium]|nr:amidohydrolase family protein [Candidatus Polarisedimenticolia bacterium]